jgi:hypothetical protein
MKQIISILVMTSMVMLAGCSKDDDFDINLVYGKWRITHLEQGGKYVDVNELGFEPTYAIFHTDGTYEGYGELGNGYGTFTFNGKTLITYVDDSEYIRYQILSLADMDCELRMSKPGYSETFKIKCRKQQ